MSTREERKEASADMRAEMLRIRQRHLVDATNFPAWRTQHRRRFLVAMLGLSLLTLFVTGPLDSLIAGLAYLGTFAVMIATLLFLRHLVRALPDMPDDALDERQQRVRDGYYLISYRVLAAAVIVGTFVTLAMQLLDVESVDVGNMTDFGAAIAFSLLAIPTMVAGWLEPDEVA